MYVRAMRDYAMLLEPTDPKAAAQWVAKAENVSANVMKHLWDSKRGQLKAHIYDLGVVCGDVWGSTRWACWNSSKGSPFDGVAGFDEADTYYHGATAVAIEAEILNSTAQVKGALARMRENVNASGREKCGDHCTIGLTLWPPYLLQTTYTSSKSFTSPLLFFLHISSPE